MINKIKIPLKVTLLTPLHIGSGRELIVGQDVLIRNGEAVVLSFDEILKNYYHNMSFIGRISNVIANRGSLSEIMSERDILKFVKYKVSVKKKNFTRARKIKEFIKDAHLNPYIPGTSIKGGIRTLIFQKYVRDNPKVFKGFKDEISKFVKTRNKNSEKDIKNFEKEVFGKDAKIDPLKSFSVSDAYLEIKDLKVYTSKIFDISNDGERCGWRKSKGRESELTGISEATPIFVEAIKDGSTSHTEIYIDSFYLNKVGFDKWFVNLLSNPYKNLSEISVEYAKREIDREVDFLNKFVKECKDLKAVIGVLKKLKSKIEKDPEAIYLRIAWGIGWRGMTGDYMDDGTIRALLNSKIIKQGRSKATIFPKTRRFVVLLIDGKEYPCFPFGWIKLKEAKKNGK
ncbi:MAG: type III-A CRISPR-associated RAMP protein Csm5 [Spirochaetes bacterium]|nr:MAG: type III-A CRISPR-associated RAMP protein Csm5 [Spirochaetota bacterium]